jgi:hypothetical protein
MTAIDHGGLGWPATLIGAYLSLNGVWIIAVQGAYVPFARRYGARRAVLVGYVMYLPALALLPLMNRIAASAPHWLWPAMLVNAVLLVFGGGFAFTSSNVLVNAAAGRELSGRINGIAGACASFFRAVGPLVAAPLFAWSANTGLSYPFDTSFVFNGSSLGLVVLIVCGCFLPKSLDT